MQNDELKLRILVAEDSVVQREHAMNLCRQCGADEVIGASDGAQALELLRAMDHPVDVALVDLEMPGMDGVTLLRTVAREKLAESVVVLSAKDPSLIGSVGIMAEADGLQVLATLKKPLQHKTLAETLLRFHHLETKTREDEIPDPTADELRAGLIDGQFLLHYQPKIAMRSGIIKGVEALIRWQHPRYGLVPPDRFIAIAERGMVMDELTRRALDIAFRQSREWQARGLNLQVSVNLSPLNLDDPSLAEWICALALQHQIDPRTLTLEITETAVISDLASAISTLAGLRLKGFGVSIDDFGIGAATVQQLSRLPVTELKVDRSLVQNVHTKPHLRAILQSTLQMGHALGLKTVAEGVEIREEWDVLAELGCDLVQGFFIARPMVGDAIGGWVANIATTLREKLGR